MTVVKEIYYISLKRVEHNRVNPMLTNNRQKNLKIICLLSRQGVKSEFSIRQFQCVSFNSISFCGIRKQR